MLERRHKVALSLAVGLVLAVSILGWFSDDSEPSLQAETALAPMGSPEPTVAALVSSVPTTTTTVPAPTWPLSGEVKDESIPSESTLGQPHPALVVKIDNHPSARPQVGLDQADIVFDLRAEGITRFAAVFHSQIPDPVGPVRSSRTSDFDLVRGLDNPIYASSGANDNVAAGLRELPIVELTNRTRNEYFRDFSRPRPHNLFVNATDLYELAPPDLPDPRAWFEYRSEGSTQGVVAVGAVSVDFTGSPVVDHEWDATVSGWRRSQDNVPHVDSNGDQLAPENVVIMITDYNVSPADPISPEVVSVGRGDVIVLTDGRIVPGTWARPTAEDTLDLVDSAGDPILLTPGQTWVLMPETGQVTFAATQELPGWLPPLDG